MAVSSRTTIAGPTGDVTAPRCGDHATHASAVAAAESSTSRRSRITPMVMAATPRIDEVAEHPRPQLDEAGIGGQHHGQAERQHPAEEAEHVRRRHRLRRRP